MDQLELAKRTKGHIDALANGVDPLIGRDLPGDTVTGWLVEKGFLAVTERPDGRFTKLPTPQGEGIGLSVETRQGVSGLYTVVLYDMAAQHFVIDNLDDILTYKK